MAVEDQDHAHDGRRLFERPAQRAGETMPLESTLTCPACGVAVTETMPTDACLFFYDCPHCRTLLRPKAGDCCVFCSFGSAPCPPKQAERARGCCGAGV